MIANTPADTTATAEASPESAIETFVDRNFAREIGFLAELVKIPTDNPPGDCAPHAARTLQLLTELGFEVEAHPVPSASVVAAGMTSVTNLIVRHRFGCSSSPNWASRSRPIRYLPPASWRPA
jgi:hypothetical protein